MMFRIRINLTSAIVLFSVCVFGQLQETAIPFSISEGLPRISSYIELPQINFDSLLLENENHSNKEKFALKISTNINPNNAGEWIYTGIGRVWRVAIKSRKANSLYLTFRPFQLSANVKLYTYSPDFSSFNGAFTSKNNNSSGVISIAPLAGEEIIVELNVPNEVDNYGEINISHVYHDFKNWYQSNLKGTADNSCIEDINCDQGKYWQTEKRAVCKIVSEGLSFTGTLVGNTSYNKTPYIITAYHAISSELSAEEAVFFFNYETEYCGSAYINESQSLSGASLIATTDHKLDFTLMRLNHVPPLPFRPFYAGWDATDTQPKSGVCIHHAFGLKKQIALEYHQLNTAFLGFNFDSLSTWKVPHWEIGSSEPGSSGAPVFDENHRLAGTLSGGYSSCSYPFGDFFTKFNLDWDKYPDSRNQLKCWLDPENTGKTYIDGYDPYGFNEINCDTAWNIQPYERLSSDEALDFNEFAEKFITPSAIKISGCFFSVEKVSFTNPLSYITIKVWEGPNLPNTEKYSKIVFLRDFKANQLNYITFDSVLDINNDFFIGYSINGLNSMDTFVIKQVIDRGTGSASSMYVKENKWVNITSAKHNQKSSSLGIGVIECYGKIHTPKAESLRIYPNPCTNYISIEPPGTQNLIHAECYSATGKKLRSEFKLSENVSKLYFDLPNGVYIIKIQTTSQQFSRIVVIK